MAQSEAAKRASAKYDRENTVQIILKLNKRTDADILDYFSDLNQTRMGMIKEAIRKQIDEECIYLLNTDTPEAWGPDAYNGMEITHEELMRLAKEWDKPVSDLLPHLKRVKRDTENV